MKLTESKLREIIREEIKSLNEGLILESTRSTVAIEDKNGRVRGTYVHSDGYLSGVGKMLDNNFKKVDKITKLIDLGKNGISYIDKSIDGSKDHSFNNQVKGETVFYGRDRGEKNDMTSVFKDRSTFLRQHSEEFAYMYSMKDKKWYYAASGAKEWKEL